MPMPSGMRVDAPHVPKVEDPKAVADALTMLADMAVACTIAGQGGPGAESDLATLTRPASKVMADALE